MRLVLEQNPPKQGLKPSTCNKPQAGASVLEQNPPKQGLKQSGCIRWLGRCLIVLEQNPPKQGLKLQLDIFKKILCSSFRAKSTKTRIETKGIRGLLR